MTASTITRLGLALLLRLLVVAWPLSAAAADRSTVEAAIADVEARFAAAEAGCAGRFAVTPCLEATRLQRREALAPLRAQIHALDDAERGARAIERRQVIEAKRQVRQQLATAAASAPAGASAPAPGSSGAAAGGRRPLLPPGPFVARPRDASAPGAAEPGAFTRGASIRGASSTGAAAPGVAAAADAARRVEARERRRRDAEADAARVRQRQAERARAGNAAAPLPSPAASSALQR